MPEPLTPPAEAAAFLDSLAFRVRERYGPPPADDDGLVDDLVAMAREAVPDLPASRLGSAAIAVCIVADAIVTDTRGRRDGPRVNLLLELLWRVAERLYSTHTPSGGYDARIGMRVSATLDAGSDEHGGPVERTEQGVLVGWSGPWALVQIGGGRLIRAHTVAVIDTPDVPEGGGS